MSSSFEALGGETVYSGRIVDMRIERFRYADGAEVSREIVRHRGAVAIVADDGEHVWLVRQPREAVGETDLLEIPAGRLDVDGEEPLAAAQRELAEEIGRGARSWEPIVVYYTGAGFTDERVHLFHASDLYPRARRQRRGRAHRDRPLAAGRAGPRDRRVPRRQDADRPAVACASPERLTHPPA